MKLHRSRSATSAIAVIAVALLAVTSACSGPSAGLAAVATSGSAGAGSTGEGAVESGSPGTSPVTGGATSSATTTTTPAPVAAVTASPAFGADEISPSGPVVISVARGTITQLSVTNPEGAAVNGTLAADGTSWTLAEPLGYGRTYTVTGTATGTDGRSVPIQGSYTTVTPTDQITTSISPG